MSWVKDDWLKEKVDDLQEHMMQDARRSGGALDPEEEDLTVSDELAESIQHRSSAFLSQVDEEDEIWYFNNGRTDDFISGYVVKRGAEIVGGLTTWVS
jgi:hypothetical protein